MINRRQILAGTAGIVAGAALGGRLSMGQAFAQGAPTFTPEAGASLRLLRWVPFVPAEEEAFLANTKKFTDATGVSVRVDKESWEDVRPKAAVAANVGSGPDMVMSWFDDPQQYPDKLVDVTDLGTSIGAANGGWYPGLESYAKRGDSFIALPLCAIGNAVVYRDSHMKAAGFQEFPKDTAGFLELCKALKAKGTPAGFPHGKAVGDGNNYATGCSGAMAARWWTKAASHHQQPGDAGIRQICDGALQDLHSGYRELAGRQQQPRLPGGVRCR